MAESNKRFLNIHRNRNFCRGEYSEIFFGLTKPKENFYPLLQDPGPSLKYFLKCPLPWKSPSRANV